MGVYAVNDDDPLGEKDKFCQQLLQEIAKEVQSSERTQVHTEKLGEQPS